MKLKKGILYLLIILCLSGLSSLAGFSRPQVLSLAIFFMVIFGTILFWRLRSPFALLGISLLLPCLSKIQSFKERAWTIIEAAA
jgi:hypothetical protein